METLLVRLKTFDPRRGHVLRRFTYAGIKFHEERGWYRVGKDVGEYLRTVRQSPEADYSPVAFDVCTEEDARAMDAREETETKTRRAAVDDIKVSEARNDAVTTPDLLPRPQPPTDPKGRKEK